MDEKLIEYHNAFVKPSDHVSFLGDVTTVRGGRVQQEWFIKTVKRFNGHKRLYLGNHDHFPIRTYIEAGFEKIYGTWRNERNIIFSHIPIHPASMGSAIANVHGHIHNSQSEASFPPVMRIDKNQKVTYKPYVNICVEVTNYHPITLDEVINRINQAKDTIER
jgi:calcineurin-like phosphoesterase family protein